MKQLSCPWCGALLENQIIVKIDHDETIVTGKCPSGNHKITITISNWE